MRAMLCRATWGKHQSWSGGGRRSDGKAQVITLIGLSVGKEGRAGVTV